MLSSVREPPRRSLYVLQVIDVAEDGTAYGPTLSNTLPRTRSASENRLQYEKCASWLLVLLYLTLLFVNCSYAAFDKNVRGCGGWLCVVDGNIQGSHRSPTYILHEERV